MYSNISFEGDPALAAAALDEATLLADVVRNMKTHAGLASLKMSFPLKGGGEVWVEDLEYVRNIHLVVSGEEPLSRRSSSEGSNQKYSMWPLGLATEWDASAGKTKLHLADTYLWANPPQGKTSKPGFRAYGPNTEHPGTLDWSDRRPGGKFVGLVLSWWSPGRLRYGAAKNATNDPPVAVGSKQARTVYCNGVPVIDLGTGRWIEAACLTLIDGEPHIVAVLSMNTTGFVRCVKVPFAENDYIIQESDPDDIETVWQANMGQYILQHCNSSGTKLAALFHDENNPVATTQIFAEIDLATGSPTLVGPSLTGNGSTDTTYTPTFEVITGTEFPPYGQPVYSERQFWPVGSASWTQTLDWDRSIRATQTGLTSSSSTTVFPYAADYIGDELVFVYGIATDNFTREYDEETLASRDYYEYVGREPPIIDWVPYDNPEWGTYPVLVSQRSFTDRLDTVTASISRVIKDTTSISLNLFHSKHGSIWSENNTWVSTITTTATGEFQDTADFEDFVYGTANPGGHGHASDRHTILFEQHTTTTRFQAPSRTYTTLGNGIVWGDLRVDWIGFGTIRSNHSAVDYTLTREFYSRFENTQTLVLGGSQNSQTIIDRPGVTLTQPEHTTEFDFSFVYWEFLRGEQLGSRVYEVESQTHVSSEIKENYPEDEAPENINRRRFYQIVPDSALASNPVEVRQMAEVWPSSLRAPRTDSSTNKGLFYPPGVTRLASYDKSFVVTAGVSSPDNRVIYRGTVFTTGDEVVETEAEIIRTEDKTRADVLPALREAAKNDNVYWSNVILSGPIRDDDRGEYGSPPTRYA